MRLSNDRDSKDLIKIYEIIKNKGFDQFVIKAYCPLQAPGLLEYKYNNLVKTYADLNHRYLMSDCFEKIEEARQEFYCGIQEADIRGLYRLNSKIKTNRNYSI